MKLKPLKPNQTQVELYNGVLVFFSYATPVAAFVPGEGVLVTEKKHSTTTSRHINSWVLRQTGNRTRYKSVPQGAIDDILHNAMSPH